MIAGAERVPAMVHGPISLTSAPTNSGSWKIIRFWLLETISAAQSTRLRVAVGCCVITICRGAHPVGTAQKAAVCVVSDASKSITTLSTGHVLSVVIVTAQEA